MNPETASVGVTRPVSARTHKTSIAMRSILRTSLTNSTMATARMTRTSAISMFTMTLNQMMGPALNYL